MFSLFSKIETPGRGRPWVYVTPAFMSQTFDDKQRLISVVYAYYYDGSSDIESVQLMNSITNEPVGTYGLLNGLALE